ncbi:MAG: ThuA domain-containing protein [Planctomycetota bacterium]|nr:MAG: ThuA domain-containing protein [Planctomycetota bacterium]
MTGLHAAWSRRRFFVCVAALAAALPALLATGNPALAGDDPPLKVCLVSGSLEYKSNETLAAFQKYIESHYNVRCSRAFIEGEDEEHLPGLENLDDCDVMLLFTRRLKLTGDQLDRIRDYCLAGKPIVGVRTASHAIQTWLELDKLVLGGNYRGHHSNDLATEVTLVEDEQDHPILAGVEPFRTPGSLYKNKGLAEDCCVLMEGTSPEATEPVTWTRTFKGGRVFYTSLGHPQDFEEQSFRRLLVNALFWAAGRDVEPASQAE